MAAGGPTVTLTFAGDAGPLERSITKARVATAGLGSSLGSLAGGLSKLGAAGAAVQVLGAAAGAAAQLAPAALILPGALLAGAAAMAVLKLATAGFGDAVTAADPAAFAEATKNMAPAAVQAASAIRDMKPALDGVKQSVQGAFFDGFAPMLTELGGSLLPTVKTGLVDIASSMNSVARSALEAAQSPFFKEDVAQILGNTAGMMGNLDGSVGSVLSGFVGLGAVGSTYLPALGTSIDSVTAKFKAWVDSGVEDGSIKAMIDTAILGFQDLGAIVGNVGSIVGSVFTGLGGSIASPLESLRLLTDQLAVFFAQASTQETLARLGELLAAAGSAVRDIFLSALNAALPVLDLLLPVVTGIVTKLGEWAPVIGPLGVGIALFAGALAIANGAISIYNGVMGAWKTATTIATGVQWLYNAALSANPIGIVVLALAALVAGLVIAWNSSETFRRIVLGAWEAVKTGVGNAVRWVGDRIGELGRWFSDLPGVIGRAVGNLGTLLWDAGKNLLTGLWNGISGAIGWLKDKIGGFFGSLLPGWVKDMLGIRSPSKVFAALGKQIPAGLAVGIEGGLGSVSIASAKMATAAADPLAGLGDVVKLGSVSASTWDALRASGWQGRAGDGMEALYRPQAAAGGSSGGVTVSFTGNTSDALATVIMGLIRTGKIQIRAAV